MHIIIVYIYTIIYTYTYICLCIIPVANSTVEIFMCSGSSAIRYHVQPSCKTHVNKQNQNSSISASPPFHKLLESLQIPSKPQNYEYKANLCFCVFRRKVIEFPDVSFILPVSCHTCKLSVAAAPEMREARSRQVL